ncbi:MAG: exonuclease domain-containing protein [Saprospiraceae bacterium]|jgi:3'-5' exoribonuclease 1|nr:exonuclease domain-containing protein [Saprospiraceae bacterium]MBK7699898.1 exonuclease domain-containing protein [Saprospiraceae bacterium]MBK8828487.1 exonuclease domain-containing protein [Saprospiraceae bacterium]MBK8888440.1 exonuclease domain-containing protein [Saprospiraceae bacterium]MBP6539260.1 exonuclease domain-containing protein [Saprospiraceae bacterium]
MNYIIFDLEASCWLGRPPHGVNEIIEIGAVKVNNYGEVTSSFSKFVKPTINPILSDFCKKLTSISQKDVDKAKKFPDTILEFQDWIGAEDDSYVLISWGKYDKTQLAEDCILHKLETEWLDYHYNLKPAYKTLKSLKDEPGLKKAVKMEGFEFTGIHHRAISDAENLAKIFIKYFKEWSVG